MLYLKPRHNFLMPDNQLGCSNAFLASDRVHGLYNQIDKTWLLFQKNSYTVIPTACAMTSDVSMTGAVINNSAFIVCISLNTPSCQIGHELIRFFITQHHLLQHTCTSCASWIKSGIVKTRTFGVLYAIHKARFQETGIRPLSTARRCGQ